MKKVRLIMYSISFFSHLVIQLTRVAIERSTIKRAEFVYTIGMQFSASQLVFVDESACDRRTTYRGRAWAIQGQRAVRKCFFMRGKQYVFVSICLFLRTNVDD